jgi:chemotaxis protein methyltransferase CheR
MRQLSIDDFEFVARLLRRRSGLVLTQEKSNLFACRVKPVLHRFGFKTITQLVCELRLGNDSVAAALTEAVTVNDTAFFRDTAQFDALRLVLQGLLESRRSTKRLRIWSAACATGQEAYSVAMLLDEMQLAAQGWMIDIVATDLSGEALARAQRGHYTAFEVQRGLTADHLARYFTAADGGYAISERLRRMVRFRRFNLLDSFGWLDDLDLVFCRNVLIYFDRATKLDILERIADTMAGDGMLLLGEAESPQAFTPAFEELPGRHNMYGKARAIPLRFSA